MTSLGWTITASTMATFIGLFVLAGFSTSTTGAPAWGLLLGWLFLGGGLLWLGAAITAKLVRDSLRR